MTNKYDSDSDFDSDSDSYIQCVYFCFHTRDYLSLFLSIGKFIYVISASLRLNDAFSEQK